MSTVHVNDPAEASLVTRLSTASTLFNASGRPFRSSSIEKTRGKRGLTRLSIASRLFNASWRPVRSSSIEKTRENRGLSFYLVTSE